MRLRFLLSLLLWLSPFFWLSSFFFKKKGGQKRELTLLGYYNLADGIGRLPGEFIEIFEKNFSLNFISTRKLPSHLPSRMKEITALVPSIGKVLLLLDLLWFPQAKHRFFYKRFPTTSLKISYSMWESTRLFPQWSPLLNRHFDAVAVADSSLIEIYKNNGVEIPIFEIPLALNLEPLLAQPLKTPGAGPFLFANLSSGIPRKNHLLLIQAFAASFKNDPGVELRINCRYAEPALWKRLQAEVRSQNLKNVVLTQQTLEPERYLDFFKRVDCYVSLSTGEGFSIQPREALALGIPLITTDGLAQGALCHSPCVRVLPATLRQKADYGSWQGDFGEVLNCSVEEAAQALLEMRQNYGAYLSQGAAARQWVRRYLPSHLSPLYHTLVRPSNIELGPKNSLTATTLTTSSQTLYAKYLSLYPHLREPSS